MAGVLKKSLASWREANGFGILCIITPKGEHFLVGPGDASQVAADHPEHGLGNWAGMSETELRQYLADRGFSETDIDDATLLSRDWATTMTHPSFFPAPPKPKLT